MIRYKNSWGGARSLRGAMTFFAADNGANPTAGTGGQSGTPSAGNGAAGGGQGGDGNVTSQPSAYDSIPWDELDANTRRILETARTDHQRVSSENATLQAQARERQQQDQLRQQQQQQQPQAPDPNAPKPNPIETRIRETLKTQGLNQQQIDAQAPTLAALFGAVLPEFKRDIGSELAPLANTVVAQQNQGNFEAAMQTEHGAVIFKDPQLAQDVWTVVQQQTAAGRTFDPEAVLNLGKMMYFDRQQQSGQPAPTPITQPSSSTFFPTVQQQPPVVNRTTGFNFPGAYNIRPTTGVNTDPNGPKHASNADTQAALATTFSELGRTTGGILPTAFGGKRK